jgi:hypothetical protein
VQASRECFTSPGNNLDFTIIDFNAHHQRKKYDDKHPQLVSEQRTVRHPSASTAERAFTLDVLQKVVSQLSSCKMDNPSCSTTTNAFFLGQFCDVAKVAVIIHRKI